ncbi:MAG: HEAT repeat domain-containing protein [Pirellulales bacterium]
MNHRRIAKWGLALAILWHVGCEKQSAQVGNVKGNATTSHASQPVDKPATKIISPQSTENTTSSSLDGLKNTLATATDSASLIRAIDALGTMRSRARGALPELLKLTKQPDAKVRWHAVRTIGLIGEDAVSAIPDLTSLLTDEDPITAAQAAASIRHIHIDDDHDEISPQDKMLYDNAIDPLLAASLHTDPRVRRASLRAVYAISPDNKKLAQSFAQGLGDIAPSVIMPVLHTLADMGDEAVPVLKEALKVPETRYWAAVALTEIGPEASPAIDELGMLTREGDPEEQMQAMLALAAIGPKASPAVPVLVDILSKEDASLQFAAVFALGSIQSADGDDALRNVALKTDNQFLSEVVSWAQSKIHPEDIELRKDAIAKLRAGLSSDLPNVRAVSTSGLSDLAELADKGQKEQLASEFIKMLSDPNRDVSNRAGAALIRMGQDAVGPLRKQLTNRELRWAILEILRGIGKDAVDATSDLVALLTDEETAIRSEAAVALGALGKQAAPAVSQLQNILSDDSEAAGTRYSAAYALGSIGAAASSALEKLKSLAQSEDTLLATVAVWASLKIDPTNTEFFEIAMPRLEEALKAKSDLVRLEAAVSLGEIGPHAQSALPSLELVEEDDPVRAVRNAAAAAIRKIGS